MGFASKLLAAQNKPGQAGLTNPYPSIQSNNQSYSQAPPQSYNQPQYSQAPQQPAYSQAQYAHPPPPVPQYQSHPSNQQGNQNQGYGVQHYPNQQQHQQALQQYQQHQPPQGGNYHQQQAPQQQSHLSGGGGGGAGNDPNVILGILRQAVQDQKLVNFFPPGSLESLSQTVARSGAVGRICSDWQIPLEIGMDLVKLSLFNTILFLDDSGSMAFEEGGSRIDDLKMIISKIAQAASLFDQDGIQIRFMNSPIEGNDITSEAQVLNLVSQVRFSGLTPLGTELNNKVLEPLVLNKARRNQLEKPVLIIVVTDGVPGGEDHHKIVKVILQANRELAKTRYGSDAVSFQLSQVGNDLKARAFLEELDNHREIGGLIDTTSNYENEADNMMKANPPVELTPTLWLVKLLMGAIDSSYDHKDEK